VALAGLKTGSTLALGDADVLLEGDQALYQTGESAESAGDVNNDGYDDIILGTQQYDLDPKAAENEGITYLMLGGVLSGTISVSDAQASFTGESAGDFAGRSVAPIGDFNADDYDDFIIGAKTNAQGGTNAGAAYLVLGPATGSTSLSDADGRFYSHVAEAQAGTAVGVAGDQNGDGVNDVLIGGASADGGYGFLIYSGDWSPTL